MRKAKESLRTVHSAMLLVLAMSTGVFLAGEVRAERFSDQILKVVGRVDHVDRETLRIVVDDRTFQLTPSTLIRLPNGLPTQFQALRRGRFVEFVPQSGGARPTVLEIRILPEGFVPPPREQD